MTDRIVKIKGANKTVRTVFDTIKKARDYVIQNGLEPEYGRSAIFLEETVTHTISVDKTSDLSNTNKSKLLNLLRSRIDEEIGLLDKSALGREHLVSFDVDSYAGLRSLYTIYSKRYKEDYKITPNQYDLHFSGLLEKELKESGITKDEIRHYCNRISIQLDDLSGTIYEKSKKLVVKGFFQYVLNQSSIDDFDYVYIQTDYKPCNSITLHHRETGLNYQIREGSIVVTPHDVYGRNVNLRKKINCDNDHVKKLI